MWADHFVLRQGHTVTAYIATKNGVSTARAYELFAQDYAAVFGVPLGHTSEMSKAQIIACNVDDADLRRYAKQRNISFERLHGRQGAFILKVHNNGQQLFVVGSDDQGTAFGLMTLSRQWGVSPFCWTDDVKPLPMDRYELNVAYEQLFEASVPRRTLILNGVNPENPNLQDLVLRLRATGVTDTAHATPVAAGGVFRWNAEPTIQPYLGLQLQLQHPDLLRLESLRAMQHQLGSEWQLVLDHQLCGELQVRLFFEMAWDWPTFRDDPYSVEHLMDLHYAQMAGFEFDWSRLMTDFFDLVFVSRPAASNSIAVLRRSIGESQQLPFQLSMDMSGRAMKADFAGAFFRNIEYPIHMATTQIQRLCNMQLDRHGAGNSWSAEDCRQRMDLLADKLMNLAAPRWREMMGEISLPNVLVSQSLMRRDGTRMGSLCVGDNDTLPSDQDTEILYRSPKAVGTQVLPYEPLRLPLEYHTEQLHLRLSLLPVRDYGRRMSCLVSVDGGAPQLVTLNPEAYTGENQEFYDLLFTVDPQIEKHSITFRTQSDGIFLQRVWLCDMTID